MKDCDKNWIEFFRSSSVADVDIDTLEAIHAHLAGSYSKTIINPQLLYQHTRNDFNLFRKVVTGLVKAKIIEYRAVCPTCSATLPEPEDNLRTHQCQECSNDFDYIALQDSITLLAHSGHISELLETSYELNALILSKQAMQRGYIYYLSCDIEGSELLQKTDTPTYNLLIQKLWSTFWPKALLHCRKVYLPLMARGDACIIAFFDLMDGINVIKAMREHLASEDFKLSVHYDELKFSAKDAGGFVRSLDNRWDLNSSSVTIFHRRVQGFKPQTWSTNLPYSLKICFLDGMLKYQDSLESALGAKLFLESYVFEPKHKEEGNFTGNSLSLVI